jgi:hypothetical protein
VNNFPEQQQPLARKPEFFYPYRQGKTHQIVQKLVGKKEGIYEEDMLVHVTRFVLARGRTLSAFRKQESDEGRSQASPTSERDSLRLP